MTTSTRRIIALAALTGIAVGSIILAALTPSPVVPLAAAACALLCCTDAAVRPAFACRTWPALATIGCAAAALWGGPADLPCAAWAAILITAALTVGAYRPRRH